MSLSCSCAEWEGEGIGWYYAEDFTNLNTKTRKRCRSCKQMIEKQATCIEFNRFQYPQNEVQCRIAGDWDVEMPLASWYYCESCGEIFLNLADLGYCIDLDDDDMRDLLEEYHHLTGWERES